MTNSTSGSDSINSSDPSNNSLSDHKRGGPWKSKKKFQQPRISEESAFAYGKMFITLLLFTITVGFAIAVYKYTKHSQEDDLERHFNHIAMQISAVYTRNTEKIVDICNGFSAVITSHGIGSNASWPYVTVPIFESLASMARESMGAEAIFISPLVAKDDRSQWESFAASNSDNWMEESYAYLGLQEEALPTFPSSINYYDFTQYVPSNDTVEGYDVYSPIWQYSPIVGFPALGNIDLLSYHLFEHTFEHVLEENSPVLSDIMDFPAEVGDISNWPGSLIVLPIYNEVVASPSVDQVVGSLSVVLPWHSYFKDLLPNDVHPVVIVISNPCNEPFSYTVNGPTLTYLGPGDFHDHAYESISMTTEFSPFGLSMECSYNISIYPTEQFVSAIRTNTPLIYTIVVVSIFLFTASVFVIYDMAVERRQSRIASKAERSNAIVTSLFPQNVAQKLMENANTRSLRPGVVSSEEKPRQECNTDDKTTVTTEYCKIRPSKARPIAELFPSATVMFADIVGFTAWSSEREPSQVFELLEKIYASFDRIAKRKGVFKVETIGDCYMAAAGLPERIDDHAVVMACFARDCLRKMIHVVRKLESSLGPSTGDLSLRIGIHSGPVTAGVLRGEKARFQLFGDTVNTAARMESTGQPNKIQVSAETAALIEDSNSPDIWVLPRDDEVEAKGKGWLQTYWLDYRSSNTLPRSRSRDGLGALEMDMTEEASSSHEDFETTSVSEDTDQEKLERSIQWTAEVLLSLLKRVVAIRAGTRGTRFRDCIVGSSDSRPLEEVVEVIALNSQQRSYPIDPATVEIPEAVVTQLYTYVRDMAALYNPNHFHNFEHATHVAMSVTKLLSRVVAPTTDSDAIVEDMHEYTFGITSDPLAQFAVAFAALIHDVDHTGVPNTTLVREQTPDAQRYKNQSVAEQNSVDVAWQFLALNSFAELRACIYSTEDEFHRFRQLVVNAVMATDIADKELGAARKARWVKAFEGEEPDKIVDANRKATIVIEHLIQASDVAHTMQHWHVYTRWNERFFHECYAAYKAGRAEKDPSIDWYTSELGFFDYYVIPLAKKLKDCQVFGVASDEYLNYAEANRKEWEVKGKDLVARYLSRHLSRHSKRNL